MIIYIIMFLCSLLLIYISYIINNKFIRKLLLLCGLLLPCLLAAFRNLSIGTDTSGYVFRLFNWSQYSNHFYDFVNLCLKAGDLNDFGYLFITFVSYKFFGNIKFLFFISEFLVIFPIFLSLTIKSKNKSTIILGMLFFYLYIYNVSLNMVRQSIAISFLILGLTLLDTKQTKKSVLCLIIAVLFHKTAVVGGVLYLIYALIKRDKKEMKVFLFLIYVISIISVLFYKEFIVLISDLNIYAHGVEYLNKYSIFDPKIMDTCVYVFLLLVYMFNNKEYKETIINSKFYNFMIAESLIILQFGMFIRYADRLSLYFLYPFLINGLPYLYDNQKNMQKSKLILIIFFIFYWFYSFVILNLHETIPYVFSK